MQHFSQRLFKMRERVKKFQIRKRFKYVHKTMTFGLRITEAYIFFNYSGVTSLIIHFSVFDSNTLQFLLNGNRKKNATSSLHNEHFKWYFASHWISRKPIRRHISCTMLYFYFSQPDYHLCRNYLIWPKLETKHRVWSVPGLDG